MGRGPGKAEEMVARLGWDGRPRESQRTRGGVEVGSEGGTVAPWRVQGRSWLGDLPPYLLGDLPPDPEARLSHSVLPSLTHSLVHLSTHSFIHFFAFTHFHSFIGLFTDSSSFFLPLTYCCSLFTHPSFIPHSVTHFLICSFILLLTNLFIRLILMGQALYLDDAGATGGPRQTPFLPIEGSRIRRGKRTYLQTVTTQGGLGCYEGV